MKKYIIVVLILLPFLLLSQQSTISSDQYASETYYSLINKTYNFQKVYDSKHKIYTNTSSEIFISDSYIRINDDTKVITSYVYFCYSEEGLIFYFRMQDINTNNENYFFLFLNNQKLESADILSSDSNYKKLTDNEDNN